MIAIVSPAKSLDFESRYSVKPTQARLLSQTSELVEVLKGKSVEDIQSLMSISENLAQLNVERYHAYDQTHTSENAKPAMLAFQGDVYQGLGADDFEKEDVNFAQAHFRMLSGLYGLLRPLDLIQPYRLEMGTKLSIGNTKTLYDYWDSKIADLLTQDLAKQGDDILLNLASIEYFKSVKKHLSCRVIEVDFKDYKNGTYKIISFYSKKARGLMSRFLIKHKISDPDELKAFDYEGYYYDESDSSENLLSFKRD